jgi:hypothetical protein
MNANFESARTRMEEALGDLGHSFGEGESQLFDAISAVLEGLDTADARRGAARAIAQRMAADLDLADFVAQA